MVDLEFSMLLTLAAPYSKHLSTLAMINKLCFHVDTNNILLSSLKDLVVHAAWKEHFVLNCVDVWYVVMDDKTHRLITWSQSCWPVSLMYQFAVQSWLLSTVQLGEVDMLAMFFIMYVIPLKVSTSYLSIV